MIELILNSLKESQSIISSFFYLISLCIFYFILQKIKNLAKESTEKTLKAYDQSLKNSADETLKKLEASLKTETDKIIEKHKKEIDLMFRDEEIRKSILQNTIINSNDIRISLYKEVYTLFFDILYGLNEIRFSDEDVKKRKYEELYEKTVKIRIKIFINSIHLGKLIDFLIKAQISFWDEIRLASDKNFEKYFFSENNKDKAVTASDHIDQAGKWIKENMGTDKTYLDFELNSKDLENLSKMKNQLIDLFYNSK